ncbi:MAG TPA: hypothetical protein VN843_11530 [Anaerolineales bacterium]|nr:hypothetical protein [Anaerolineales bacterium]
MSLMMYKNRILSADRRMADGPELQHRYSGLEHYSKLYVSKDKELLMGAVGGIPSVAMYERFKNALSDLYRSQPSVWQETMLKLPEFKEMTKSDPTLYLFFAGDFLLVHTDKKEGVYLFRQDLSGVKLGGSGVIAATVLIRSGMTFALERFYRIVSASTESVSPMFDHVCIDTIKGFSQESVPIVDPIKDSKPVKQRVKKRS